ncbi:hypothetical protein ACJJTC_004263 [Scirpophaga incertulas]
MKILFDCVVIYLCFGVSFGSDTYRAGVIRGLQSYVDLEAYPGLMRDASEAKLDILLLAPSQGYSSIKGNQELHGLDSYDEVVKLLSGISKKVGSYLVAHFLDSTKCQQRREQVRSNVVFNRRGEIVTEYRKPVSLKNNCTSVPTSIGSFETDFGETIGLMMEEDLVLLDREDLKGLRHFIVTGGWSSDVSLLSASQFPSSWAWVNKANVVSSAGIFGTENSRSIGKLMVADFNKHAVEDRTLVPTFSSESTMILEDLSMYIVRRLDPKASIKGYKETVCHEDFCCEFYVKTKFGDSQLQYGDYVLSAFNGVREYSPHHDIGMQTCAIFACAGIQESSCDSGFKTNDTVTFEKLSVTGNFTGSTQYPIVTVSNPPGSIEYKSERIGYINRVSLLADNIKPSSVGIFGGEHSRDSTKWSNDVSDNGYLFNDQMQELFDYLWIRLRILIFVVSIYVLEMM